MNRLKRKIDNYLIEWKKNERRVYFADTGLLIGSLDEETQADLRNMENFIYSHIS